MLLGRILIINFLFLLPSAYAQISICSTDINGKSISWDSSWAEDKRDQGQDFTVNRVTNINKAYIIDLIGPDSSFIKNRSITLKTEETIRDFCSKIDSADATYLNETDSNEIEELRKISHIRYGNFGWERGNAPSTGTLSSCFILGRKFSCTVSDKKAYSNKLSELENEVKLMDELGY